MNNVYKILMNSQKEIEIKSNKNNSVKNIEDGITGKNRCPHCKCDKVIKFGFYNRIQRYKCKNEECGKTFINDSNNPFRCAKKFKDSWEGYFELFIKGATLRECALKMNITLVTAFFWRHRFLNDLKDRNYIEKIGSYVELTKMVTLENFKGDRKYHGEKRDKIIVVNAINDSKEVIPIIAGRYFLGFYEIRDNIIPILDRRAYVVGYIDGRLKNFAKAFNEINKVKSNKSKVTNIDKMYSIKTKRWLNKFNGVASKYLDHYLSWRAFEYKNNIDYRKDSVFIKTTSSAINIKAEVNTYLSWNNIKAKFISV